jgi:hypothetical protein
VLKAISYKNVQLWIRNEDVLRIREEVETEAEEVGKQAVDT